MFIILADALQECYLEHETQTACVRSVCLCDCTGTVRDGGNASLKGREKRSGKSSMKPNVQTQKVQDVY